MKIKIISLVLIMATIFIIAFEGSAMAEDKPIQVAINGSIIENVTAIEVEGEIFLPVRAICEHLGYDVSWSAENWVISVRGNDNTIIIEPYDGSITVDGQIYSDFSSHSSIEGYIGSGCILKGNRTHMRSGDMDKYFGLLSSFDEQNKIVLIDPITISQLIAPETINSVGIQNIKCVYGNESLKTTINYPRISFNDSAFTENNINAIIKEAINTARLTGWKNALDLTGSGSPNKCETYFDYRIEFNNDGFFSIVLQDYQYAGGAHGGTIQTSYTFALNNYINVTSQTNFAVYQLSGLFTGGTKYIAYINAEIRKVIDARIATGELVELQGSEFTTISDNQDYYLSEEGLVVYFQQYEHFPYAAGIQEFTIPYGELASLLRPEFRLLYSEGKL